MEYHPQLPSPRHLTVRTRLLGKTRFGGAEGLLHFLSLPLPGAVVKEMAESFCGCETVKAVMKPDISPVGVSLQVEVGVQ